MRHLSPSYFPERYPQFNCFTEQSISGLTIVMMLEYLSIRLDIEKAAGKAIHLNLEITDRGERYEIEVKHCVMNFRSVQDRCSDCTTVSMTHHQFGRLALLAPDCNPEMLECKVSGNADEVHQFIALFEQFPFWFNIIEA